MSELSKAAAQFWHDEGGRLSQNFQNIFARESFDVARSCPFNFQPCDFETKERLLAGLEAAYKEVLDRVLFDLREKGMHLLSVVKAEVVMSNDRHDPIKTSAKEIHLWLRVYRPEMAMGRWKWTVPKGKMQPATHDEHAEHLKPLAQLWGDDDTPYKHKGPMDGVMPGTEP